MIFILNFRETTNIIQERNFVKWFFLFFLNDIDISLDFNGYDYVVMQYHKVNFVSTNSTTKSKSVSIFNFQLSIFNFQFSSPLL